MRINEIFYSLQGEGHFTGTPSIFVRMSGCNLKCSFCDTEHQYYKEYSLDMLMDEILQYPARRVVLTAGEPMMQITPELLERLHEDGYFVSVETNGAFVDANLFDFDWITYSPKNAYESQAINKTFHANEMKMVMDDEIVEEIFHQAMQSIQDDWYYLQPCDVGDMERNNRILKRCIEFVLKYPVWRLFLQTHKILDIR